MGQARKTRWADLRSAAQWSPLQAQWVLDELRRSGLSVQDFAAKHEVGSHRIYYWRERLKTAALPTAQLVEVRMPSDNGTLKLWDMQSCMLLRTFEAHSGPVLSVALSGDGRRALLGSYIHAFEIRG